MFQKNFSFDLVHEFQRHEIRRPRGEIYFGHDESTAAYGRSKTWGLDERNLIMNVGRPFAQNISGKAAGKELGIKDLAGLWRAPGRNQGGRRL